MKKILISFLFILFSSFSYSQEKLKIGITLLPYYSFVKNIVKDRAEVIPVVKAESFDSHTYQPKVEDIQRASTLDVIVVNGIGHDEFIFKILNAIDTKRKIVVIYQKNSRDYVKKLRKLKTDALKEVQNINGEEVRIATFLGGYNYLLSEFGIDVKAVIEPTHGSQVNMAALQKMIEKIKKDKIDIIFGEKTYSDEYTKILHNETGIEVRKLEHLTTGKYTADSFEKFIKIDLDEVVKAIRDIQNKKSKNFN